MSSARPPTVTNYSCKGGLAPGVTSVPDCSSAIGTLTYSLGTGSVAQINAVTNQITAELPGTTAITASVALSGSSAGYFSTCPPKSISVTLNGTTTGTVTQGVQQNLTTTVTDTNGNPITGLTLDYQSTNPLDITAAVTGGITASFPGAASVYAICQPAVCNPAPINEVGLYGTGLSISSNPVNITTPGTASAYMWFSAPGKSQYFVPVELISGTLGSTVRLPYVPNSMVMDRTATNLYFGSAHELMVYSTATNSLSRQDTNVPGVVLAVSPNNQTLIINDPVRQIFYLYSSTGSIVSTFGGLGHAASWTPDSKTLYVTDSSSLNNPGEGITGHTDTLYVYNANTGWTTYPLPSSSRVMGCGQHWPESGHHDSRRGRISSAGIQPWLIPGAPAVKSAPMPAWSFIRKVIRSTRRPTCWPQPRMASTSWAPGWSAAESRSPISGSPFPQRRVPDAQWAYTLAATDSDAHSQSGTGKRECHGRQSGRHLAGGCQLWARRQPHTVCRLSPTTGHDRSHSALLQTGHWSNQQPGHAGLHHTHRSLCGYGPCCWRFQPR